jgi:L-threonylcarbamoyladenylate synthase
MLLVLDAPDARRLRECLLAGGVAVFPADTVYGLACDPLNREAVRRLYALKGRPPERPASSAGGSEKNITAARGPVGQSELERALRKPADV